MEFDKVINNRHSARLFRNESVSQKELENILRSGSYAPSAKNRQPWKFYILNNEQKEHIMNLLFKWEKANPNSRTSVKGTAEQIKTADKMVMIYIDTYKSKNKKEYYQKPDYISVRMCFRKHEFTSC